MNSKRGRIMPHCLDFAVGFVTPKSSNFRRIQLALVKDAAREPPKGHAAMELVRGQPGFDRYCRKGPST